MSNYGAYGVARWGRPEYEPLRLARNMTGEESVNRAKKLRAKFCGRVGNRTINHYALDNPFMTEGARKVLLNEAERLLAVRAGGVR